MKIRVEILLEAMQRHELADIRELLKYKVPYSFRGALYASQSHSSITFTINTDDSHIAIENTFRQALSSMTQYADIILKPQK